jgi:toxin ParE1/3/4
MRALRILAEAEQELQLAIQFYEGRRRDLGRDFLSEVRAATDRLVRRPEAAHSILKGVRRAGVHRFPYDVIYRIKPDAIEIIAIMHHRRAPEYWINRL